MKMVSDLSTLYNVLTLIPAMDPLPTIVVVDDLDFLLSMQDETEMSLISEPDQSEKLFANLAVQLLKEVLQHYQAYNLLNKSYPV